MELYKTTILPVDDRELAKKMFRGILYNQPFVLFVAIGSEKAIEDLVTLADTIAGGGFHETDRRVVWLRDAALAKYVFDGVECEESIPSPLESNVAGFFVNLNDKACDSIQTNELPVRRGRLVIGFIKGSAI